MIIIPHGTAYMTHLFTSTTFPFRLIKNNDEIIDYSKSVQGDLENQANEMFSLFEFWKTRDFLTTILRKWFYFNGPLSIEPLMAEPSFFSS